MQRYISEHTKIRKNIFLNYRNHSDVYFPGIRHLTNPYYFVVLIFENFITNEKCRVYGKLQL